MQTPLNPFKLALSGGTTQIGLWLGLADPCAAELCATAGFDWLLIDGEHGPNDLRSVLAVLQAVAPYPSQPVVRIPHGDAALIKQVLEIGATTLLVPMVESAEQARQLVRAMRYPRAGFRGVGSGLARSSRWSAYPNYLKEANDSLCLLVQVETAAALEQIDAIAAVDETLARRYIELGARFVAVGVEATMLAQAARALATRFRGAAGHGPGDRRTSNGY